MSVRARPLNYIVKSLHMCFIDHIASFFILNIYEFNFSYDTTNEKLNSY